MQRMCDVSLGFWAMDLLHVTDYHGVTSHCLANVVHDVVRDNEFKLKSQAETWDRHAKSSECTTRGHSARTCRPSWKTVCQPMCFATAGGEGLGRVHPEPTCRLNLMLKAFYSRNKVADRCELNMKTIGGEQLDHFPMLSGAGIKGATVRNQLCFQRAFTPFGHLLSMQSDHTLQSISTSFLNREGLA